MIVYGWDSCVYAALFNKEEKYQQGIEEIVGEIERNECRIVSSILVKVEILNCKYQSTEQQEMIRIFFRRPEIEFQIVNQAVVDEAERIRSYVIGILGLKIHSTDAVHLATGILFKAHSFHTMDKDHLLPLNGKLPWTTIKINEPHGEANPTLW